MLGSTLSSGKYPLAVDVIRHIISIIESRPSFFEDTLSDLFKTILYIVRTCAVASYKAAPMHPLQATQNANQSTSNASFSANEGTNISEDTRLQLLELRDIGLELITELFETQPETMFQMKIDGKQAGMQLLALLSEIMLSFKPSPLWETDDEVYPFCYLILYLSLSLYSRMMILITLWMSRRIQS